MKEKLKKLVEIAEFKRDINLSLLKQAKVYNPSEAYIYAERSISLGLVVRRLQKSLKNYE